MTFSINFGVHSESEEGTVKFSLTRARNLLSIAFSDRSNPRRKSKQRSDLMLTCREQKYTAIVFSASDHAVLSVIA